MSGFSLNKGGLNSIGTRSVIDAHSVNNNGANIFKKILIAIKFRDVTSYGDEGAAPPPSKKLGPPVKCGCLSL